MNRHEPFLAAVGQHWGSWIKHQCETRHEHQRKGHLPTPAVELPRLLPVAATGLSAVSSGTRETSCHLREPVWVPFVMPCSLDGHTWATQSTCIDLLWKMGQSDCLYNDGTERGGGRRCEVLRQHHQISLLATLSLTCSCKQHTTTQASCRDQGQRLYFTHQ